MLPGGMKAGELYIRVELERHALLQRNQKIGKASESDIVEGKTLCHVKEVAANGPDHGEKVICRVLLPKGIVGRTEVVSIIRLKPIDGSDCRTFVFV